MSSRPRVLAIVGPTGTGKTEIAAEVARRSGAEIIGSDSVQVYRGMDIGTAKPDRALRAEIPHHIVDIVDPDDPMSAGRYLALARQAADQIHERDRPIILCGGTGLYARAFARGLVPAVESDPAIRAELLRRDTDDLYAELEERDPESAARIHAGDRFRIVRALEAQAIAGRPLSEQHAEHRFEDCPFEVRWMGLTLEHELLLQRIARRVERMFEVGFVEEVRGLYAAGYPPSLRSLQAIGYREVGWLLEGRLDEAEAREAIVIATRRYARRQGTWFRREPGLSWVDASNPASVVEQALECVG